MPVSAADVINPAIDHTAGQLFRPFRLGQWTRLAVTGILAGELGSMGGCSFQIPSLPRTNPNSQDFLAQLIPPQSVLIVVAIVILVLAGVALLIGLMYVSSVMRFVLFDSVVARECHIRRFWSNRRRPGFRYFVWQLLFTAAMMAVFVLIAGAGAAVVFGFGWFRNPREHLIALILCGVVFFIVFIAFVVTALVIAVLTKDFVVPQMALEDISAIEGWRRLWAMMNTEKARYAGYVGMKILLSIAGAIGVGIAAFIVILALLVPMGVVGLGAFLGGRALGLVWNAFTISAAVVAGSGALAVMLYAVVLVSVPVMVFFPAYSLYFFAPRYQPLNILMRPPGV